MKKICILLPACLGLLLAGCGGKNNSPSQGIVDVTKYTVTFAGTNKPAIQVEAGQSLSKPADPEKDGYLFVGWYSDSGFTQEVSFPLVINADTTIYGQYYSYAEAFAKARSNTIGENVPGYEYDYTLEVRAGYMGATISGNTEGNTKYNRYTTDVKFYDAHVNSGLLFYDGSKYEILKEEKLHKVSLNEDGEVKKYEIENVGADYQYDSSSFAKAVFEYDDSKLKSISKTSVANEYKLDTAFNASAGISLVGNYVNHPMVEKIIGSLPETSVNTGMYVTFSGDKLNSYRYEMNINVSGVTFSLAYALSFKNIGVAPIITPKVFNGTYVSNADVTNALAEINGHLNTYKALEHSSYDLLVKTAVDYEKKNAINATIDGFTKRKVTSTDVYYLNDYEVDTDHRNADLYEASNLKDCHGGRAKLSNGEVHNLEKKLLGGYKDLGSVAHEAVDNFYLMDVLAALDNISFIQKIVDTSNNKTTYAIGGDNASAVQVLNYFNNNLRLNAIGECSVDVKAFGSFDASSVKVKEFKFKIIIQNGSLVEINLTMNGALVASFPGSRDFTNAADAGFKLTYKLKVTNKASSFEPASSVSDI